MRRLVFLFLLATSTSTVLAQYSAGSYGGGGSGGNPGGTLETRENPNVNPLIRQDEDRRQTYGDTKSLIWSGKPFVTKTSLRANEAVVIDVSSEAFDTAIAVTNSLGKVLASNENRSEFDQNAFLVFAPGEAGDYEIRVTNQQGVGSGKFVQKTRTFFYQTVDPTRTERQTIRFNDKRVPAVRVPVRKGQPFYFDGIKVEPYGPGGVDNILTPSGVAAEDVQMPFREANVVFPKFDGYVFLESSSRETERDSGTLQLNNISIGDLGVDATLDGTLSSREVRLLRTPVTKDLLVRLACSNSQVHVMTVNLLPSGELSSNNLLPTTSSEQFRIFRQAGTALTLLMNYSEKSQTFKLQQSTQLRELKSGSPIKDQLKIGESHYYRLTATRSELLKLWSMCKQFDLELQILSKGGTVVNELRNSVTHSPGDDLFFPAADTFYVRAHCFGDGGSGEYQLVRDAIKATVIKEGVVEKLKLDGTNFGSYEVKLNKGVMYEVQHDGAKFGYLSFIDQSGRFLQLNSMGFGSSRVYFLEVPETGTYRIWLRGEQGLHKVRIRPSSFTPLD